MVGKRAKVLGNGFLRARDPTLQREIIKKVFDLLIIAFQIIMAISFANEVSLYYSLFRLA